MTARPDSAAGLDALGHCRFERARRVLERDGVEVPLDRACTEILLCLLDHAGEVVTKDELLEAAWPGRVVSENSLNKAVGRLRAALGDEGQKLLRTVHGYGYRYAGSDAFQNDAAPAPESAARIAAAEHVAGDPLPGRDGWFLLRRLGHGGFGDVWLVHRRDDGAEQVVKFARGDNGARALKREVALHKLMNRAAGELAPAVPLLGWSLQADPFFIEMPYVPGGNLRQWADRHLAPLSLDRRIDLVTRIAEAVARIHALGIIHKDLKPENILVDVDEDGTLRPLLTDFGAGGISEYGSARTGLTLSTALADALRESPHVASALYSAPESLRGEVPTPKVDVYSLGVLLYQLIVGDLRRPLGPGWEQDVGDELLRGDVAAAAALAPDQRTDSARTLAEALRWLEWRRSNAEKQRALERRLAAEQERAARVRARRRLWIAAAALLGIGMASTTWMYLRAERATVAAEREARRAQAMLDFVNKDVIASVDPYQNGGRDVSLREAVDHGAAGIDRQFTADPIIAMEMHHAVCKAYAGLGDYDAAVAHCRSAEELAGQTDVAPSSHWNILVDLTSVQIDDDRTDDAERSLDLADALLTPAEGASPQRLRSWATRAQLYYEQGRFRDSAIFADKAIDAASDATAAGTRADALWYGALSKDELADYAGSERDYNALIALRERAWGPEHGLTAWAYCNYGALLAHIGRTEEAESMLRESVARMRRALGADHSDVTAPLYWLGKMYLMQERFAEAEDIFRQIAARRREKLGPNHTWTVYADLWLADANAWLGRPDEARRIIDTLRPLLVDPPRTAQQRVFMFDLDRVETDALYRRGEHAAALVRVRATYPLIEAIYSRANPLYGSARCMEGRILLAMSEPSQARPAIEDCERILSAAQPAHHPERKRADALMAELRAFEPASASATPVQPTALARP